MYAVQRFESLITKPENFTYNVQHNQLNCYEGRFRIFVRYFSYFPKEIMTVL